MTVRNVVGFVAITATAAVVTRHVDYATGILHHRAHAKKRMIVSADAADVIQMTNDDVQLLL